MVEKYKNIFSIIQSNEKYLLTTSLLDDKLKLVCIDCQDSNMETFFGEFSLMDLMKISQYFRVEDDIAKIQVYLNIIIEKQNLNIYKDEDCIKIIFYLINNDTISIPLTKKLISSNNHYNISNQFGIKPILFDINELNKQLLEEREKNKKLEEVINNLNNMIKSLTKENKNLNNELNKLNKTIKEKDEEIQDYKFRNNNIIENNNLITSIKPGEKVFSVLFMTEGSQDIINYCMACKNTDLFVRLEEKLYNDFPKFRNYETFFMVNTKKILRFKTLDENNIKNNDIIHLFINEIYE